MFTECPECSTGFRVTPQVLKQAGGRVRCGGCGNAFSAIDHLTEEPPGAENNVDNPAGDDLQSDDKFAETSRQLLETLDELAGPDEVRIEDTGIEWRVLDDNEGIAAEAEIDQQDKDVAADAEASQESLDLDESRQEPQEERRYDDDTPLPDEFEDEEEYQYTPPARKRRASDIGDADTTEFDEKQADLALSEPGDWTELLDEVIDEGAAAGNIPLEVEEELAAIHSELSAKELPPAIEPEDDPVPADIDSQFEMQAEAMGIDISGIHETAKEQSKEDDEEKDEVPVDDADENDLTDVVPLLDEDEGIAAEAAPTDIAAEAEIDRQEKDVAADAAPAEDEAGKEDLAEDDEAIDDEVSELESAEELESTGEFEAKIDVAAKALADEEDEEEDKGDMTLNDVIELSLEDDDEVEIAAEAEATKRFKDANSLVDTYAANRGVRGGRRRTDPAGYGVIAGTIFLALLLGGQFMHAYRETLSTYGFFNQTVGPVYRMLESGEVETIIMEGEFIHDSKETARLHAEAEATKRFKDANSLVDTYAANRGVRGGRRRTDPAGYGVIAGTIFLALLLGGQFMHAYRETLSTYGFFNQTVGPVYRMLGNPVTPEWDIKGWQFEATNGSVAEASEVLTIVSRIGNKSQQPLPYPLVHVSLTDRYEEIIGSRVLEPNEYLAGDLDPSKPVVFGENFTAVITIDEPSAEATGFKLNVCYRVGPTRVRCAIEDFKNQD